ncbi:MAG: SDR family oxidoreductase [Phormidesmis sp. CAN_BIN36]|nr:SDR family oxidoreductase [Phormidesmis sp. CAN_BIN36]
MNLKPIDQQVVVVVGASSGIGRDTALKFAQKGAKVVVSARSKEGLATLVEEISAMGGSAIAVPADVADFNQVKEIAEKTIEHFGRLDTWVHLAATSVFATFDNVTPEEFKRVIDVNLMGQAYGAMVAIPYLKREGRGALIHITSLEGRRSLPYQSAYSASKHGTIGFIDAMRLELKNAGYPISVTNIMPGVINTPFYNKGKTKLGVKPTGVPPYYNASLVTDAILYAAENPVRDYIVSDVGRILDIAQRVSPGLVDALLLAIAFPFQKTDEPKSEESPNNLYEPIQGYDKVEGDFDKLEIPSIIDTLDKGPAFAIGAFAVAALGVAALLGKFGDR